MKTPLRKKLKASFKREFGNKTSRRFVNRDKQLLKMAADTELSKEEQEKALSRWSRFGEYSVLEYHKLYKHLCGFDERYVPVGSYIPWMIRSLNPERQSYVFLNKGLYGVLYPDLPQAKNILLNIDGTFFDGAMQPLDRTAAIDKVVVYGANRSFIMKPIAESGFGAGVAKIALQEAGKDLEAEVAALLDKYQKDFVVQEVVEQHEDTAVFNPESLNTCRLTSLNLNGKVSVLSTIFRCGQYGAIVDNGYAGGIMIGVNPDGSFHDYGYDTKLKKYTHSSTGVEFKGRSIPNYQKMVDLVMKYQPRIPTCHILGWDIAMDRNGEPVMVELNVKFPGITMEQLCTGPIFGDRTDEVLQYVEENPPKLYVELA